MSKMPDFMQPLFEKCTPFTDPKKYFRGLGGVQVKDIEILNPASVHPNRVMLSNIRWNNMVYSTIRVFQHDENDNEFYIAEYPRTLIHNNDGPFIWPGEKQLFDNLPSDMMSMRVESYIAPLVYEMNERKAQGILPQSIAGATNITKTELAGELYGPTNRDELINHMRLHFAYL